MSIAQPWGRSSCASACSSGRARPAHDHLPAVGAAQPLQEGGRRADDIGLGQAKLANRRPAVRERRRLHLRGVAVAVGVGALMKRRKWRVAVALARSQLGGGEGGIVVRAADWMQKCSGLKVCNQHTPGRAPRPARPATCVSSWKARSEARKSGRKSAISAETTPTSVTAGQIQPLGDHLRAHQHVGPALGEGTQQLLVRLACLRRVAVPAQHPRRRETPLHGPLHALGAQSEVANAGAPADRADVRPAGARPQ